MEKLLRNDWVWFSIKIYIFKYKKKLIHMFRWHKDNKVNKEW